MSTGRTEALRQETTGWHGPGRDTVPDDSGVGSSSVPANGVDRSVDTGAEVITASLGGRASRTSEAAVDNVWNDATALVGRGHRTVTGPWPVGGRADSPPASMVVSPASPGPRR